MKRKRISDRTKLASALLARGEIPYITAKDMPEAKFLALYDWHHNIFHSWNGSDEYWNIAPMLRTKHREQTKSDIKTIAKSKRVQRKEAAHKERMERKFHE